jgi:methionyl-tRNA formyltransferase
MNTSSSRSVVSVTLICSAGELIDRLLSAWDRTGQHLRAVVVSETPRRKPLSAPLRRLQRAGVPVLRVDYPVDWEKTGELLAGVPADVLVCYGFMRLIPQAFLNLFPCGGVNFHPALLPAYAGPHPARCLAADGTYGVYGGVTLHRMTEAFDEGTVLARSKFLTEDYRSARRFRDVLAETMAAMIRDVLPLHCAGRVREEGQEGAVRTWARYHPRCVIVDVGWPADDIAAALDRPDSDTLQLPSGKTMTVGLLKLVREDVERRLGRSLTAGKVRPDLSGPAVKVQSGTDWKNILQRPDGTVLESPGGKRITVGELKQVLAATGSSPAPPVRKP